MQPKWSQGGWSTMIARHTVAEDPTEAKLVWSWSPDRSRGWPKGNDFCIYSHLIWWISLDLRLKDCWIILVGLLDISCSKSFVIVLMGETGQGVIPRDAPVFDASHTEIDAKSCQSLDGFWHSLGYARCLSLVSIWMVKCFLEPWWNSFDSLFHFGKNSFFFNAPWCSSFGHFRIHLCDYAVQTCDMPRAMTLPFNHDDLDLDIYYSKIIIMMIIFFLYLGGMLFLGPYGIWHVCWPTFYLQRIQSKAERLTDWPTI